MKINTILSQIDLGSMALPEFQRGYVWNRDQVRDLMFSLYRKHPVGSLLVWSTKTEIADTRGDAPPAARSGQASAGRTATDHVPLRYHQWAATALFRWKRPGIYRAVLPPGR